jgi:predicted DNA-binding ribbon-helix-helix protein
MDGQRQVAIGNHAQLTGTMRPPTSALDIFVENRSIGREPMAAMEQHSAMKSPAITRSIVIGGHTASISIEQLFWISLKEIARERATTLSKLTGSIDEERVAGANLSSAVRVYVAEYFRTRLRRLDSDQDGEDRTAHP